MTTLKNPYQSYQRTQVETASPGTLLLMLYNGAIKFLRRGKAALVENDIAGANYNLGRAQDILSELMGSLEPGADPLSGNLFALYEGMHHFLVQANVKKEVEAVEKVERMLTSLRDAWQETLKAGE